MAGEMGCSGSVVVIFVRIRAFAIRFRSCANWLRFGGSSHFRDPRLSICQSLARLLEPLVVRQQTVHRGNEANACLRYVNACARIVLICISVELFDLQSLKSQVPDLLATQNHSRFPARMEGLKGKFDASERRVYRIEVVIKTTKRTTLFSSPAALQEENIKYFFPSWNDSEVLGSVHV
jgi:hypothetical protein